MAGTDRGLERTPVNSQGPTRFCAQGDGTQGSLGRPVAGATVRTTLRTRATPGRHPFSERRREGTVATTQRVRRQKTTPSPAPSMWRTDRSDTQSEWDDPGGRSTRPHWCRLKRSDRFDWLNDVVLLVPALHRTPRDVFLVLLSSASHLDLHRSYVHGGPGPKSPRRVSRLLLWDWESRTR